MSREFVPFSGRGHRLCDPEPPASSSSSRPRLFELELPPFYEWFQGVRYNLNDQMEFWSYEDARNEARIEEEERVIREVEAMEAEDHDALPPRKRRRLK